MFVNFPTGFGKSLIYQALPLIQCRYNLKGFWPYVVVVVSPLVNLMKNKSFTYEVLEFLWLVYAHLKH